MRLRLMVISSTFVLAACVPRAGTDYPVTSKAAAAAQSNPQIVAEQDLVVEPPSWSAANVVRNARQVSASVYARSVTYYHLVRAQSRTPLTQFSSFFERQLLYSDLN